MPYKRYDIKNKYNYRGRRKDEPIVLKTILLIVIPIIILAIIALGIFLAFKFATGSNTDPASVATSDEEQVVTDEELLLVVNEHNPIESDFTPSLAPFGGVRISSYMFDDLDEMISDAAAAGIKLSVTKGYVSYDEQAKLYDDTYKQIKEDTNCSDIKAESETKKICPQAGCSESQTGMLIMLSTDAESFEGSEAELWLEKNAVNYGFILRYPEGREDSTGMSCNPQLYRYVGREHALNIRRYGMTLEEYSGHKFRHS